MCIKRVRAKLSARGSFTIKLWQKVILGMLLGIVYGMVFKDSHHLAKPLATVYMSLVKMIVVPTIFFAIIYGITNISDIRTIGRVGLKSCLVYLTVTIAAVAIGIVMAVYWQPGIGINLLSAKLAATPNLQPTVSLTELFVNIFPSNPIAAMANANTLQIVFFSLILGLSLVMAGESAATARAVFASVTSAVFKMIELVIRTTPYGAFALMAWMVGEHGFSLIISLGKLAGVILATFMLQYLLFGLMLLFFRLNPLKFYKKTLNIQSIAFATSSSKASIVPAIKDLQEKVGVSQEVASFVLPLGAAINMTGSAIYIAICTLFFAQVYGVEFSSHQYLILAVTSTIGSIGAAGYPSGAVIMLSMVLPSVGLPVEGIPLIMGIDRLLDMFRTVVNVTGDCAATVVIDKLGKTLDLEKYKN